MKKLINLIKKVFIMAGGLLLSIYTKVYSVSDLVNLVDVQPDYGVVKPKAEVPAIWKIAKWFIIPIAFIIGSIMYFKKSSKSTLKKVIIILIALAIVVLACFIINYVIICNTDYI